MDILCAIDTKHRRTKDASSTNTDTTKAALPTRLKLHSLLSLCDGFPKLHGSSPAMFHVGGQRLTYPAANSAWVARAQPQPKRVFTAGACIATSRSSPKDIVGSIIFDVVGASMSMRGCQHEHAVVIVIVLLALHLCLDSCGVFRLSSGVRGGGIEPQCWYSSKALLKVSLACFCLTSSSLRGCSHRTDHTSTSFRANHRPVVDDHAAAMFQGENPAGRDIVGHLAPWRVCTEQCKNLHLSRGRVTSATPVRCSMSSVLLSTLRQRRRMLCNLQHQLRLVDLPLICRPMRPYTS